MSISTLRTDMDVIAARTWERLRIASALNLRFGEVTITETNLMDLATLHPELNLYSFNPTEERTSGADWAWWIGSAAIGWIGLHIQAKRAYVRPGAMPVYKMLSHKINKSDLQMDVLVRYAATEGAAPLHVMFNCWDTSLNKTLLPAGVRYLDFGCSAISTHRLRRLWASPRTGRLDVSRYSTRSIPWSRLFDFGPPGPPKTTSGGQPTGGGSNAPTRAPGGTPSSPGSPPTPPRAGGVDPRPGTPRPSGGPQVSATVSPDSPTGVLDAIESRIRGLHTVDDLSSKDATEWPGRVKTLPEYLKAAQASDQRTFETDDPGVPRLAMITDVEALLRD